MKLRLNLEFLKTFRFYPEIILLISFLLCVLKLDLVVFTTSMSRDLSRLFEITNRGYAVEVILFIQILISFAIFYFLLRELKKHHSIAFTALFSLLLLLNPQLISGLRQMGIEAWLMSLGLIALIILPLSYLVTWVYEKFLNPFQILKISFYAVTLTLAAINVGLTLQNYSLQAKEARILQSDMPMMTLKTKKFIYSMISSSLQKSDDPFENFHGRSINRMRRDEMNANQTQAYFGLYKSLSEKSVQFTPEVKDKTPDSSWLFQLRNQKELALNPDSPFLMSEIKPHALPQKMVIKYLNETIKGVQKTLWKNSNLILPFTFLNHPSETKIVRLEFELNSPKNQYLNLLIDADQDYKLLQVKINKKVQTPLEQVTGDSTHQAQFTYKIPDPINNSHIVIEIKVNNAPLPNFSRVDIFASEYLLSSEF